MEVNKCPDCGGDLKEKMGKFGRFIGCSNYPNCRYIRSIR
ncbi:MAG: topoisomerase DNA-binding C4 zinc finger domain-containing protein [Suipraeoptans sp.]